MAVRLRGRGYPDAMEMTPGQLLFACTLLAEADDHDFYADATAVRLGHHGSDRTWEEIKRDRLA